jgi:molybdate transport system regulatory protein
MPPLKIPYGAVLGTPAVDKRLEVLRSMHHAGSISEAARANGVSFKAAWQALETLGNLAGVPLVEKSVGGSGGGGAKLTRAGISVLEAADLLHNAREQALAQIERSTPASGLDLTRPRRIWAENPHAQPAALHRERNPQDAQRSHCCGRPARDA